MTLVQVEEARKSGRLVERPDGIGFALTPPRDDEPSKTTNTETTTTCEAAPAAVASCGYQLTATTCNKPNTAGLSVADCPACNTGTAQNNAAKAAEAAGGMPPRCNYPGEGFAHITLEQWKKIPVAYRGWVIVNPTDTTGMHRVRHAIGAYVLPGEKDDNKRHSYPHVYITDEKRTDPPRKTPTPAAIETPAPRTPAPAETVPAAPAASSSSARAEFEAMRETLRAGVQVVSVPQLFPTPAALAQRMANLAEIRPGDRVLEPSAGTGRLLGAMGGRMFGHNPERGEVVAIEVDRRLAARLRAEFPLTDVRCADFLSIDGPAALVGDVPEPSPLGSFDVCVMNPPFSGFDDIKHIRHAVKMLKPGGRLVAICANGPRQNAQLRPFVEAAGGTWEDLPPDTFKDSGTAVNTALVSMVLPS
jgi:SAM-dependent methyltransferase